MSNIKRELEANSIRKKKLEAIVLDGEVLMAEYQTEKEDEKNNIWPLTMYLYLELYLNR